MTQTDRLVLCLSHSKNLENHRSAIDSVCTAIRGRHTPYDIWIEGEGLVADVGRRKGVA